MFFFNKCCSFVLELKIKTNPHRKISVWLCRNVCSLCFLNSIGGVQSNYFINSAEGWMTQLMKRG
jgi:hypothetical protein